jgi:hypothetical protein
MSGALWGDYPGCASSVSLRRSLTRSNLGGLESLGLTPSEEGYRRLRRLCRPALHPFARPHYTVAALADSYFREHSSCHREGAR